MSYQSDQSIYLDEELRAEYASGELVDVTETVDMPEITPSLPYIPGKEGVYEAMATTCVLERECTEPLAKKGYALVRDKFEELLFDGKTYPTQSDAVLGIL